MASPRTESPRNSRRSYEAARLSAHEVCVKTCAARSSGSDSMRAISSAWSAAPAASLLMGGDVVDGLPDGLDSLRVLVGDLDPELVLELHDELDEIERVGVQVFLEVRLLGDLALLDPELLDQDVLDLVVDLLAGRCHRVLSPCGAEMDAGC